MSHIIKQLEDRNVASEITCMVWSNRMDLVAYSNVKGELALHRLTWARAWIISPPREGAMVNGVAWRPDGKLLAVAYSDGSVLMLNVESKASVMQFEIPGEVSFISWIQEKPEVKPKNILKLGDEENEPKFIDLSKPYLRDPPPVSHLEGAINFEDLKGIPSFLQEQSEFSLLVIGTKEGLVHLRIFGCWNCLELNISDQLGYTCCIENVQFTENLSKMFVTISDASYNLITVLFESDIFRTHKTELYHVTMKYIKIFELILYLEKILTNITETWESILLEVDQKLSKYAGQVPEGGVTADFLELLMFGTCSERLEEFLIHDLTKKGLEKFGQTMEVSYSNIQAYLFRHIIKFSQNGTFHLSELKGMAEFKHRFGIIGLNPDLIREAIRSNGAFVLKAGEMQQIINHSVVNYKAFFRWLYGAIMLLMDEAVPSEIQKMTQQDVTCIAEFLQNFDNYGRSDHREAKFVMERLGQYLVDADLTIKPDMSGNDWSQYLEENECLKNHPEILTHFVDKSLIQVFNQLKGNFEKVFQCSAEAISKQIVPVTTLNRFQRGTNQISISSINMSKDTLLFAFLRRPSSVYLFQVHLDASSKCYARCGSFFFTHEDSEDIYDIVDIQFYSTSILSVLLQEKIAHRRGIIWQFPVTTALEYLKDINLNQGLQLETVPSTNGSYLTPRMSKNVEMSVSAFAVSGSRRVSIVLSENKRKVKLYEMECEEDEEDEGEGLSLIKEDVSMQEDSSAVE